MIKKISHACMCMALFVGLFAFIACSNSTSPSQSDPTPSTPENPSNPSTPSTPENPSNPSTPSTPENPSTPSTPSTPDPNDPKTIIYGEYTGGNLMGIPVTLVLRANLVDIQNSYMPKKFSNIKFTDQGDGKWYIECYDTGAPQTNEELKASVLIDTNEDPFTALITIHGMSGSPQITCEKTGGKLGLIIKGSLLKGYRGAQPTGVLTVPEGITDIAQEAFQNCTGLTEVKFPSTLKGIYGAAFSGCSGITELHFPENLTTIAAEAFYDCTGLKTLDFSKSTKLKIIENETFRGCSDIETLNLPTNLEVIGSSAFNDCAGISGKVQFPATLKEIGASAFFKCKNITELDFSACTQLTKIANAAFNRCTGLTQVKLPASLTKIGNIFTGCTKLSNISIDSQNPELCSVDNIIYNKAKTELIFGAPSVPQANTIPSSVTKISENAFINNQSLSSVQLPASLLDIEASAFDTCKKLQNIDFSMSTSLKTIGDYAFNMCEALTGEIVLPATLTTIGEAAFYGCKNITKIDLYSCAQIDQIGFNAFNGYTGQFKVKAGSGVKEKLTGVGVDATKIEEVL
ncbi:leucine-rich repeat protein [Treponema pectinovorum]|uniref:leucine-rich repeat protein n=1 Tax=Treponema pectinovorum TaxID=164 RepID=UPI003D8B7857